MHGAICVRYCCGLFVCVGLGWACLFFGFVGKRMWMVGSLHPFFYCLFRYIDGAV